MDFPKLENHTFSPHIFLITSQADRWIGGEGSTVMNDTNNSISHERTSLDDMNDSTSLAQVSKCYEHIRVVDEMNDSRS